MKYSKKYNPYTDKDDEIIKNYVARNPNNLTYSFRLASKELNRCAKSIDNRWYNHIRHEEGILNVKTTSKTGVSNAKNIAQPQCAVDSKTLRVEVTFNQIVEIVKSFTMNEKQQLLYSLLV